MGAPFLTVSASLRSFDRAADDLHLTVRRALARVCCFRVGSMAKPSRRATRASLATSRRARQQARFTSCEPRMYPIPIVFELVRPVLTRWRCFHQL